MSLLAKHTAAAVYEWLFDFYHVKQICFCISILIHIHFTIPNGFCQYFRDEVFSRQVSIAEPGNPCYHLFAIAFISTFSPLAEGGERE